MDLLAGVDGRLVVSMRLVLSAFKYGRSNITALSSISILLLREEIGVKLMPIGLFIDAIIFLDSFSGSFFMLLVDHSVVGSHLHDLITQNMLILQV